MNFLQKYRRFIFAVWCAVTVFIIAVFLLTQYENDSGSEGHGVYVRPPQENNGVIVFVHGVLGDGTSTWTNPDTKAYWPDLMTKDPIFDHYNIYVYEFPSPIFGKSYTIDELTENMRLVLDSAHVLRHGRLIFLSHSMGGLVTRAFVLKYRDLVPKIQFLYFFSTPTTGSEMANVAELVSQNPQFKNMFPMGDNAYIESLQSSWLAAKIKVRSYCAYEVLETFGIVTVPRQSATSLCTEPLNPIRANHISIVKPADQTSVSYVAFRDAFVATHNSQ